MAKKKFKETAIGKALIAAASLINPALGAVLTGAASIPEAIEKIGQSNVPIEDQLKIKALLLEAYETEVNDRISARQREAAVLATGGTDILFKTVGWGITLAFLLLVLIGLGYIEMPGDINMEYLMFTSGAVSSAFMAVVSYYFGSSLGSKQKTQFLNDK